MKKLVCIGLLSMLVLPVVANAAPGNGIDVQWQDCVNGAAAVQNRVFNCNGNSTHNLIFNFKTNVSLPTFGAFTAFLDLQNETPGPLAAFWHYEVGGCQRMGGTSPDGALTSDGPLPGNCEGDNFTDIVNGNPSNGIDGILAYTSDNPVPGRAKLIIGDALSGPVPVVAGDNKYAMTLTFNTRNRIGGPGGTNCAGCGQAVAIVWNTAVLESFGEGPVLLSGPDKNQNCGTIQGASVGLTCAATPVRNRTWGSVKALYR